MSSNYKDYEDHDRKYHRSRDRYRDSYRHKDKDGYYYSRRYDDDYDKRYRRSSPSYNDYYRHSSSKRYQDLPKFEGERGSTNWIERLV